MPKILSFKADVSSVKYSSFENKNAQTKETEPTIYVCNAQIREVGQGLAKSFRNHQLQIFLSKEEFDNKIIEKGDRLLIKDKATWFPMGKVDYITYDPKKIEKHDKSELQLDSQGRTYAKTTIYPYIIRVKEGQFKINCKWFDKDYCTVVSSRIKLPLDSQNQFEKEDELAFYLDKDEYDKLEPLSTQNVQVISYHYNQKKNEKTMELFTMFDEQNNAYILSLKAIDKENNQQEDNSEDDEE